MKSTPGVKRPLMGLFAAMLILAAGVYAAAEVTRYAVHDQSRPRPPVVAPAAQSGQPPSDAVILFDGTDLPQWQSYDIAFLRPLFDDNGNVARKARITVFHNGVCVHNNLEIEGTTSHKVKAKYTPHGDGPIGLQDHGNPISFRNIWVRQSPEQPYLIE